MRDALAVVAGGILGTALRLATDGLLSHGDADFPWSTLIVNTLGAFVLGFLVARVWADAPSWLRAGLGVGVLGSFTTFSAVVVSLVSLADAGQWVLAAAWLAATLVLGLGAAWLGIRWGRPRGEVAIDLVDE